MQTNGSKQTIPQIRKTTDLIGPCKRLQPKWFLMHLTDSWGSRTDGLSEGFGREDARSFFEAYFTVRNVKVPISKVSLSTNTVYSFGCRNVLKLVMYSSSVKLIR